MLTVVSRAFQTLSDAQKRAIYDANPGADPDSRFSGMRESSFRGPGAAFEGEMSPEDLFNMFFGGGGAGFGNGRYVYRRAWYWLW